MKNVWRTFELFFPFFWEAKSHIKNEQLKGKGGAAVQSWLLESKSGSREHGEDSDQHRRGSGRWGGLRWCQRRRGDLRCVLKVLAAAFADGLDLVVEGERIIKNFPLNRGTFPRREGLEGQLLLQFSAVQFSRSVVSDSLRPRESQHARPPCPSPSPAVHSDSRPSSP